MSANDDKPIRLYSYRTNRLASKVPMWTPEDEINLARRVRAAAAAQEARDGLHRAGNTGAVEGNRRPRVDG